MKKIFIILWSCLLIISCQRIKYNDTFLKQYTYVGMSGCYIIVPMNQTQYICIENDVLNQVIYKEHYLDTYKDYLLFLHALFNTPQKVNITQYVKHEGAFDITLSNVYEDYLYIGIDNFITKYMKSDEFGNYKSSLSEKPAILIIAKIMFDNGYFIYFDDYKAEFSFSKDLYPLFSLGCVCLSRHISNKLCL